MDTTQLSDTSPAQLPNWLADFTSPPEPSPPAPDPTPSTSTEVTLSKREQALILAQTRKLLHLQFENFFEHALGDLADGKSLPALIKDDARNFNPAQFMRWILGDPTRRQRYYDALEVQSEVMFTELAGIADATDNPMEDTQRSALRIKTRQWQMGVSNRKRFGDIKQLDVTTEVVDREALRTMTTEDLKRMALSGEYSVVVEDATMVETPDADS